MCLYHMYLNKYGGYLDFCLYYMRSDEISTNIAAMLIETQRKPVVDVWYSLIYVTLVYILWV